MSCLSDASRFSGNSKGRPAKAGRLICASLQTSAIVAPAICICSRSHSASRCPWGCARLPVLECQRQILHHCSVGSTSGDFFLRFDRELLQAVERNAPEGADCSTDWALRLLVEPLGLSGCAGLRRSGCKAPSRRPCAERPPRELVTHSAIPTCD